MRLAVLLAVLAVPGGACKDDDDLTTELGLPCSDSSDCTSLCLPPSPETPNGLCTRHCTSDDECPPTAVCVARSGGVCLYACRDGRDCDLLESGGEVGWTCDPVEAQTGGSVLACVGD